MLTQRRKEKQGTDNGANIHSHTHSQTGNKLEVHSLQSKHSNSTQQQQQCTAVVVEILSSAAAAVVATAADADDDAVQQFSSVNKSERE